MGYSKLVVVVSVLVPFFLNKVSKRISSSLTIPTVLTRRNSKVAYRNEGCMQ